MQEEKLTQKNAKNYSCDRKHVINKVQPRNPFARLS